MLARKFRVKREMFPALTKKGTVFHEPSMTVRFLKQAESFSRFGVVVPKSVSRKASARNLLKRRLWSCIQENQARIVPSFDIVFFMKKGSEKLAFSDLKIVFSEILKKFENRTVSS